jgi:hypothetical protein
LLTFCTRGSTGAPITTPYFDVFDPSIPDITFISENFANLVIKGPLRRNPLYPNLPVGNPAVFTINSLALAKGTVLNEVSLNILSPDNGSVLETLKKEVAKYPSDYLLLGIFEDDPNATPTPAPTGTASATPSPTSTATPVSTGTPVLTGGTAAKEKGDRGRWWTLTAFCALCRAKTCPAPPGIPPVNGVCDPYGGAPNQCFSASGGASICCPGQVSDVEFILFKRCTVFAATCPQNFVESARLEDVSHPSSQGELRLLCVLCMSFLKVTSSKVLVFESCGPRESTRTTFQS